MTASPRTQVLLSAIDNALRNGSYMTGANLAFEYLCDELNVERDHLPPFNPCWVQTTPDLKTGNCPCGDFRPGDPSDTHSVRHTAWLHATA